MDDNLSLTLPKYWPQFVIAIDSLPQCACNHSHSSILEIFPLATPIIIFSCSSTDASISWPLEKDLGELAKVFTLHGYSQSLLHKPLNSKLRDGLTSSFRCLPGLASIIKKDWKHLNGEPVPHFVALMRQLSHGTELDFYKNRANYYDAVDFDDSVYRTYQGLKAHPENVESYDLVLINEYQDFNRLEAGFIDLLAEQIQSS